MATDNQDNYDKVQEILASEFAMRITNPMRTVTEGLKMPNDPDKKLILLAAGDPTLFGNLRCPPALEQTIVDNLKSGKYNGYQHSTGNADARAAIAERYSEELSPVTKDDVLITSGCAGALDMAITGLLNPGENLLLPQPGFPAYETFCTSRQIEPRFYRLLPEKQWESDLEHMQSLIDDKTRGILVTNPSNPCGSVYSKKHLLEILELAERNNLPIITDEIYGDMTFGDNVFYPLASLSKNVPIIMVGGMGKHFLVPGWRIGWVVVYDKNDKLKQVRAGFGNIALITFGANSLCQSTLPAMLTPEPGSELEKELAEFKKSYFQTVEDNAKFTIDVISKIPGMRVVEPQGALYAMVEIDPSLYVDIEDDMDFMHKFLEEESVLIMPGKCFEMPNFFRTITCPSKEVLEDAYTRMANFCKRHSK